MAPPNSKQAHSIYQCWTLFLYRVPTPEQYIIRSNTEPPLRLTDRMFSSNHEKAVYVELQAGASELTLLRILSYLPSLVKAQGL